jgi:hypothetical protein
MRPPRIPDEEFEKKTMNWDNKVKMNELANHMSNPSGRAAFQAFVLSNLNDFDLQAWDMFAIHIDIIESEMIEDKVFWSIIYPKLRKVNGSNSDIHFSSGMRIQIILKVCEEKLGLK